MTVASPAARWTGPPLQRLLAEIDAGRIGMVVVYKIDRLTRSLVDFGRSWSSASMPPAVPSSRSPRPSTPPPRWDG
jgi:hypothetical protein